MIVLSKEEGEVIDLLLLLWSLLISLCYICCQNLQCTCLTLSTPVRLLVLVKQLPLLEMPGMRCYLTFGQLYGQLSLLRYNVIELFFGTLHFYTQGLHSIYVMVITCLDSQCWEPTAQYVLNSYLRSVPCLFYSQPVESFDRKSLKQQQLFIQLCAEYTYTELSSFTTQRPSFMGRRPHPVALVTAFTVLAFSRLVCLENLKPNHKCAISPRVKYWEEKEVLHLETNQTLY